MSYDTPVRINELSKELGISSKEIIEKLAQMSITGKTHSSTLTPDQIKRLQEFMALGSNSVTKKPKAFIVKKAKNPEPTDTSEPEKKEETPDDDKKSIEKTAQPIVQVVKTQPAVNRLEIVRRAPKNEQGEKLQRPQRTYINKDRNFKPSDKSERGESSKFPPRNGERKPFDKSSKPQHPAGGFGDKKPIERRIIPQDMYENKSSSGRGRRPDNKKKGKEYKDKKEEQERISLEKAAAQHHKKHVQKGEEVASVSQLVVTEAMTISQLSEKINKSAAEIVKFLMLNGVMATLNQLIDVDVIKKICANFEIEVLEEDLDAYIEEELEKEQKNKALSEIDQKLLKKRRFLTA